MSGFKFGNGLNLSKKPAAGKPPPAKKSNALFGGNDSDSDDQQPQSSSKAKHDSSNPQAITELDDIDFSTPPPPEPTRKVARKAKSTLPTGPPPSLKNKQKALDAASATLGDLSSALTSRKHQEAAESADKNIYDYDAVYDSLKPPPKTQSVAEAEDDARPRYMTGIVAAAAVRKRDALAAEQVKIERDREDEGDEFADKEVFETAAYRRQKEEKKQLDVQLKQVEEEEARKRKGGGGMTDFYKKLLREKEEEHAAIMQAAERRSKMTPEEREQEDRRRAQEQEKSEAERAREINERGGNIAINEDGQVVDKRQLLHGGLNVLPSGRKKDAAAAAADKKRRERAPELGPGTGAGPAFGPGGRRAMRERQSKMMEEQLAESLKRAREEEEKERVKIENMNKSRKTESDISSAKERYLARKRAAAEEAKKKV